MTVDRVAIAITRNSKKMAKGNLFSISVDNKDWLISVKSCDRKRDKLFIQELTRLNCYEYLVNTIGWNEDRHLQEPKFPERYLMLFDRDNCIGFLSLRSQPDCLYLETLQLIEEYRKRGIGSKSIALVEDIAREKSKDRIRLRVINGNPAKSLYFRSGFEIIEDQQWCFLMEKVLNV